MTPKRGDVSTAAMSSQPVRKLARTKPYSADTGSD